LATMLALAAAPAAAPLKMDAPTRRAILTALVRELHARFVYPDSVAAIAARLESRRKARAYDSTATPAAFAAAVTEDLRPYDLHFALRYDTEREAALLAAGTATMRVLPELDPTPDSLAAMRRGNFGTRAAEILPGNIGYVDLTFLHDLRFARASAEAAIDFVSNSPAVILDLRRAPGGYGTMVQFLASAFFGPDSVEVLSPIDPGLGTTHAGRAHP